MHQVRLAQPDTTINKQRVVELAQAAGHMHGGRAAHAIGCTFYQGIKGKRCIQAVFKRRSCNFFGNPQARRLRDARALKTARQNWRLGKRFTRSDR